MSKWDPTNPPLMLPNPPNTSLPGAGGYPFQGLWSPQGEGNPLLWKLVELLTQETARPQKRASRKNIIDRRGGAIPVSASALDHLDLNDFERLAALNQRSVDPSSPIGVLLRFLTDGKHRKAKPSLQRR